MKKRIRIILIVVITLLGILILDTMQALYFNNSPIFKIREDYNGGTLYYKDNGLLVDTYMCTDGNKTTVLKGFSFSCSSINTNFTIVDTTLNIKDFACAEMLEEIYKDSNYTYYLSCLKSKYIEVRYSDGTKETIKEALKNGNIKISDLDKFNIEFLNIKKVHSITNELFYFYPGLNSFSQTSRCSTFVTLSLPHDVHSTLISLISGPLA